ncbi:MAG: HEAT repeat domain-containing protein [Gemmatimonadetes bacterium]|nr:HEAT repeat domain-containing protein [Gemmatimonadota bacterium]
MAPLGYRRATPVAVPIDGPSMRDTLRALARLVEQLRAESLTDEARAARDEEALHAHWLSVPGVRDAVRLVVARVREASLLCRLVDGDLIFEGEAADRASTRTDAVLEALVQRCHQLGVGSIAVRQGASPGELLTLAAMLARAPRQGPLLTDTPTTMSSVAPEGMPRELLRSWSVLVLPAELARARGRGTPADGIALVSAPGADGTSGSPVASALARLAAATSDDMAMRAVDQLLPLIGDAELRGDAVILEGVVRAAMAQVHLVGGGPGRLALERLLRRMQRRGTLELLARCVPQAVDRLPLLELLARAGELSVDILVQQLMEAEDSPTRRAYFDSVVSLDLGATLLFEKVHDPRWYVVRNVVALLGEMGVEQADAVLLPLLTSDDERLRIAVARALLRLGTPRALQGLHAAIEDSAAEVRRIAAVAYGLASAAGTTGIGVRPPAARLAAALEHETDEDVALEMLASLGRLGSADAIQRLLRIALPATAGPDGVMETARREAWMRVAAIEALVRARGLAVQPAIDSLINDPDPDVAATARRHRT